MKLDQIAYYAHNEEQVREIKRKFVLEDAEWIEDEAFGDVGVWPIGKGEDVQYHSQSRGLLRFNYDLGIELEILTYLEGPHWHMFKPAFLSGESFISHIGFHMEGEKSDWDHFHPDPSSMDLVQVMDTINHTNPYIVEKGRTYHYEIYSAGNSFMPDMKYIWRVENDTQNG